MINSIKIEALISLTRINRPIGIFLLLWPTLWALWLAADGFPEPKILLIFIAGVVLMRSAGCVINDFADRNFDGRVNRTQNRPLATGLISAKTALVFFLLLCLIAFALVLLTNLKTILLSLGALALASAYPFMKRYTYLPQVVLGAAFAWAIPMAYTALDNDLNATTWLLYTATVLWTVAYDTQYAMVDRDDDLKVGIKSTAILFGEQDRIIIVVLQGLALMALILAGLQQQLAWPFYLGIIAAGTLFGYQWHITATRDPGQCFVAFLNNNWVGLVLFLGIFSENLI